MLRVYLIVCLLGCIINVNAQEQSSRQEIDQEIGQLKQQLHDYRIKEANEQVDGQALMIADWAAYENELQSIRNEGMRIKQLEDRLRALEKKKNQAEKNSP